MPVTCNDLQGLKSFSLIRLLAGEKGLGRVVTWPHIGQTAEISPWVHGGELLFITGIEHGLEMLPGLLDECIRNNLAGLVILVGSEYIEDVPPELAKQADAADFPLFAMPFELKLVDVMKEIADLIVRDKLERKKEEDILERLLFDGEGDAPELVRSLFPEGRPQELFCFVCLFGLSAEQRERAGAAEHLQYRLLSLCAVKNLKVCAMVQGGRVVCLALTPSRQKAEEAVAYLEASRDVVSHLCGDAALTLAFGRIYSGGRDARKSCREAFSALELAGRIGGFRVVHYKKLGIYRLLLHLDDSDMLREFYHDFLDPLLLYDRENNASLVATLKGYLLCNGNITRTAQEIFVHRNTLLYRLNQIRELTDWDLEDARTRMNLLLSILIMEYLQDA